MKENSTLLLEAVLLATSIVLISTLFCARHTGPICFTSNRFSPNTFSCAIIVGHQELCDYCPAEFEDENEEDVDESFKRHHHHRHRVRPKPVGGERRHPKGKRPTTSVSGEYEIDQSKRPKPTIGHIRQHHQLYSDDKFGFSNDELQSTTNADSAYYNEYKFDDNKMTLGDNGKSSLLFVIPFSFLFFFLLPYLFDFYIFKANHLQIGYS